jgi:hypothetical protein
MDISLNSLIEAQQRSKKVKNLRVCFAEKNCSQPYKNVFENFPENIYFDFVSSQFVIHYMFTSKESVANLLQNLSEKLLEGGFLLLTIPDIYVIIKSLRNKYPDYAST